VADQLAAKLQTGELFKKFHDLPLVGLATISPQTGRWENFNDHLCVILGYSREALVAKTWIDVAHPDDLAAWRAEGDRITRKEIDAYTLDTRLVRHYGEVVFATINIRAVRGGDGSIESIFATVQDITERKRAEASLRRLTQLYAALGECNAAIMRAGAEAQVFQHVTRIVVGLGGMKMAWIGMVDSATQMIRPVASAGEGQEYLEDLKISVDPSSEYGNGPTGTAVREGRALWSQNFQTDPATAPWHARGSQFGWRGSASLPLNRAGRAVGSLTVYAPVYDAFDSDAQNLLIKLAEQISFAMDNFDRENERRKAELSLRESEVRNSALVKAIPDLIFTNRRDGEYLDFEASDPGFLAAKPDTFLHKSVYDVLPAPVAQQFMQAFAAALDSHALRQITYSLAFGLEVKQFEARVVPYEDDKVISIVRDITEKERAQAEIAASEERFRSLVDQVISGIYIVQDGKFTYVNRRFAQIAGYDSPDEVIGLDALSLIAEPERAFVREQMRSRFSGETPSGSYTTVGLRKGGSTVDVGIHGALATFGGKPAVIGMMQDISEKKRAEDQAARYLAQLQTAFMRTVEVATTISEMRDPYTAGHEKRVAKIAMAIGAEMGFDAQRLEGLRVGGYLHDVGKITIPAEILAKPGKLSAIEYELIKGHAQAGYDILKDVEFPWPVAQMAYQHHERLDGSGYPRGLKGEAILLEARIMAVADTVEAMSSHRPYRAALGKEKALEEIARGRGSAYDPVVADACLRLFREKDYALPD
jgi:PAS domain S-box-containing protein/putative nucleotidyltransferase with HDIG domain